MRRLTIDEINNRKPKKSRLTAIKFLENRLTKSRTTRRVESICICGKITPVNVTDISTGHTLSCGCYGIEQRLAKVKKYSKFIQGIYASYSAMMNRCYNKKRPSYKYYGAKGVIVCDEWRGNYEAFMQWSLNNGWQKGYHLDKDKLGNGKLYSPETCEWMTAVNNLKYKKNGAILLDYKGSKITLGEMCKKEGLNEALAYGRIKTFSIETIIKLGNKKYSPHEIKKLLKSWQT